MQRDWGSPVVLTGRYNIPPLTAGIAVYSLGTPCMRGSIGVWCQANTSAHTTFTAGACGYLSQAHTCHCLSLSGQFLLAVTPWAPLLSSSFPLLPAQMEEGLTGFLEGLRVGTSTTHTSASSPAALAPTDPMGRWLGLGIPSNDQKVQRLLSPL